MGVQPGDPSARGHGWASPPSPAPETAHPPASGAAAPSDPAQGSPRPPVTSLAKRIPGARLLVLRDVGRLVRLCLWAAEEGSSPVPRRGATGPGGGGRAKAAREGGPRQATACSSGRRTSRGLSCWGWASAPGESGSVSDRSPGELRARGWSYCMLHMGAKGTQFSSMRFLPLLEFLRSEF